MAKLLRALVIATFGSAILFLFFFAAITAGTDLAGLGAVALVVLFVLPYAGGYSWGWVVRRYPLPDAEE